jgi:hypothetical protein
MAAVHAAVTGVVLGGTGGVVQLAGGFAAVKWPCRR